LADRIVLSGLRFHGRHGVFPEEAVLGQPFLVDVELRLDLAPAGRSDDLARSVDYGEVYRQVGELVGGPPFKLIESLAEAIAARLLRPPVREVLVRVHKPQAPIPGTFADVFVEIVRRAGPGEPA
jgi:7,8-dihydroneopterin aldolase/epimerase/oxygenase